MTPYLKELSSQVCTQFGVSMEDVLSESRKRPLVLARREIWTKARAKSRTYSTVKLGRYFNRDHTTISRGIIRYGKKKS